MLLLAILLIAWGLVTILNISGLGEILAILAIAAGIFILLNRKFARRRVNPSGGFCSTN